jgi:hypothetical protein
MHEHGAALEVQLLGRHDAGHKDQARVPQPAALLQARVVARRAAVQQQLALLLPGAVRRVAERESSDK